MYYKVSSFPQLILPIPKCIYTWKLRFNLTFRATEHSAFLQGKKSPLSYSYSSFLAVSLRNTLSHHRDHYPEMMQSACRNKLCAIMSLAVTDLIPVSHCYITLRPYFIAFDSIKNESMICYQGFGSKGMQNKELQLQDKY